MNLLLSIIGQRRRASLDPDALDYFSRAEALGGSFDQTAINALYTEAYCKTAISDCIAGLKTDVVWGKITELYLMGFVTFAGLTAKVKHAGTATLTNTNFTSGDYLAAGSGAGLKGNGSNKHLNTSVIDTSLTADSKSLGVYVTQTGTGDHVYIGARDTDIWLIDTDASNQTRALMPNSTAAMVLAPPRRSGMMIGNRNGVNNASFWVRDIKELSDTSTGAASNQNANYYLFARGTPTTPERISAARMTAGLIGTGLTDTEAANLSSRINTLMTTIGANVY